MRASERRVVLPALVAFVALLAGSAPAAPAGSAPGSTPARVPAGDALRGAVRDTAPRELPPPDWQQRVRYRVQARLDEEAGRLEAAGTLRYENASPDTLRRLYVHLYLNAFRPNSVWARNEKREAYDYQALTEPDYGYERLRSVRLMAGPGARAGGDGSVGPAAVGGDAAAAPGVSTGKQGTPLRPRYPHAPDSTVVRLELPEPLPPGAGLTLRMRWDARPATLCRRQCRRGRHWDFAQWYPRVAVYDRGGWEAHPLYPQGEFYGEFGTYDVTLDLAEDQVVGATGVPVEGDPGWEPGPGSPASEPLYQEGFYGEDPATGAPPDPGLLEGGRREGRRRVRFRAEDVHHFAWSASPDFRWEGTVYERGALPDVAVHALLLPGDTTWDEGVAVERNVRVLSWLESVFRPYPYPQITWLHRLEGGATEFPMLVMAGSVGEGLVAHELAHQYAHGILANNEWKEAWLDEGMASFLDTWYPEEHGEPHVWRRFMTSLGREEGALHAPRFRRSPPRSLRRYVVEGDTLPAPMPVDRPAETFPNYSWYGHLSYSKPQAVFYMLRELVGKETMRRILRTYYDRYRFRHVNGAALRTVAGEVSGRDLGWFFDQWLRTTKTLDYRVASASTRRTAEGLWRTTVEVVREGEAWMPVTLALRRGSRRLAARELDGRGRTQTVELTTRSRPDEAVLDPGRVLLDVRPGNNRGAVERRDGSGSRRR